MRRRTAQAKGGDKEWEYPITSLLERLDATINTLSSRLRNGHRRPSVDMLNRIKNAYDLDADELLSAFEAGPKEFSKFLRERVFEASDAA